MTPPLPPTSTTAAAPAPRALSVAVAAGPPRGPCSLATGRTGAARRGRRGGGPGAAVASGGWVRQLKVLCVFALLLWLMIDQVLLRWEVNRLHQLQEVAGCGCNPLPSTSTELLQGAVESLLSGAEMRQGAVGSLLSSAELPEA